MISCYTIIQASSGRNRSIRAEFERENEWPWPFHEWPWPFIIDEITPAITAFVDVEGQVSIV